MSEKKCKKEQQQQQRVAFWRRRQQCVFERSVEKQTKAKNEGRKGENSERKNMKKVKVFFRKKQISWNLENSKKHFFEIV